MNASPQTPSPELLSGLVSRAKARDGQSPFSDQSLVEFERGERVLLSDEDDGAIVGAAIVSADEFELVIDPDARGSGRGTSLATRVLADHPEARYAWAHGDHPASRTLAARFGFLPVRTLLQLIAPVAEHVGSNPAGNGLHIAAFRPGTDDAAWLALNARAFADHPEQGKLTQRDLDDRLAEPWFDPEDFLLLVDRASSVERPSIVGFCWLKVDGDEGEFYAVGIDSDRQGEGLGRILMEAGFSRLAQRGIRAATLYVEADNDPALALYRRYGFGQNTIDIRYHRRGN